MKAVLALIAIYIGACAAGKLNDYFLMTPFSAAEECLIKF